jgi:hypothetical protein
MIHFIVPRAQEWGIGDYLNLYAPALAPRVSVLHYEDLPERTSVASGSYIVSALDQLSVGGRRLAAELAEQLEQLGAGCRVINHPARALLRLELLETLHREGLNQHRAARANGDLSTLRFPVFLREEFRHSGTLTPLLQTRAELDRALGRAVLRGFRLPELLVVEFCETADAAGRYRKYAAFGIGSEIVTDGLCLGREWMLKAEQSELSEAALLEERAYVLGNPHERSLRRIFELARVEYGRIDYAIKDGRVETWEINLNPTIRRGRRPDFHPIPEALDRVKDVARQHFLDRFEAALGGLDPGVLPVQLRLAYGEGCREEAMPMIRTGGPRGWLVPAARVFRPIVPFLDRMSRAFTPLVARAARRRRRSR